MPTALELKRKQWRNYNPLRSPGWVENASDIIMKNRKREALKFAREAAELLKKEYGATKVVIFGSLTHNEWFNPWSDIDLASWGIAPERFYSAVAAVTGLSSNFRIDLVDSEDCKPTIRKVIERDGIDI